MAKESHKQAQRTPPAAQQQLIWRALVGSLVFCAALAAPARAQQVAQPDSPNTPQEAEAASPPSFNLIPFRDLVAKALRLRAEGALGAGDTFDFTVEADRAPDGTLSNAAVGTSSGNEHWRGLARDFASALSDSRLLSVLRDALHVRLSFRLDAQGSLAGMTFDAPSEEGARRAASYYGTLFHLASTARHDTDAGLALKNLQVSASGKQVAFKLEMSREQLGNLLRRSLSLP
jgi:hypothetical protein